MTYASSDQWQILHNTLDFKRNWEKPRLEITCQQKQKWNPYLNAAQRREDIFTFTLRDEIIHQIKNNFSLTLAY